MKTVAMAIILMSGLTSIAMHAATPPAVPGGLQGRPLNPGLNNQFTRQLKGRGFTIDSRVKRQLKKSFTKKMSIENRLEKVFKKLNADITKLRRAQHLFNTSGDRCLAKTYTEQEKRRVRCLNEWPAQCAQALVVQCMRTDAVNHQKAQRAVYDDAQDVTNQVKKYMSSYSWRILENGNYW